MTKNVISSFINAARDLWRGWPALGVLAALYAALLGGCYLFITTREATVWQLGLTALLALAVPVLLFVLLAGSARVAVGPQTRPLSLLAQALTTGWKIFLVSLPLVGLAVALVYGAEKLENRVKPSAEEVAERREQLREAAQSETAVEPSAPPVRWKYVGVVALELLLLGVVLPLFAAGLWLAVARDGLGKALRRLGSTLALALAPQSVLTYAAGMILFALVPYFLIYKTTPTESNWLELALFTLRLALAFALTLFGWTLTLRALERQTPGGLPAAAGDAATAEGV
ncbi:MAG: hypothetical protein ACRD9R_04100 [Pyrinomonadaceae bacterium]